MVSPLQNLTYPNIIDDNQIVYEKVALKLTFKSYTTIENMNWVAKHDMCGWNYLKLHEYTRTRVLFN